MDPRLCSCLRLCLCLCLFLDVCVSAPWSWSWSRRDDEIEESDEDDLLLVGFDPRESDLEERFPPIRALNMVVFVGYLVWWSVVPILSKYSEYLCRHVTIKTMFEEALKSLKNPLKKKTKQMGIYNNV